MTLLKTIVLPNTLVAHGQNHLLIFQAGEVKRYRKSSDNTLVLLDTFALAGVKRLTISEDGQCFAAQTSTHTHRLHMPESEPLAITGAMAISNSNYLLVLQPTAVQLFRESTVILTATTDSTDKICCGLNGFVVYSKTRALTGTYTGVVLTNNAQAKTLLHVAHTGSDKFAYFYSDGTVTLSGTTRTLTVLKGHRNIGQHVLANDGTNEWSYIQQFPLTQPTKLRPYVPPPIPVEMFTLVANGTPPTYTITSTSGVEVEDPPSIGEATITLPPDNWSDSVTIVFDQPLNLAVTDWTLEWSSFNTTPMGASYYSEIAMLPAVTFNGITGRYGDSGFAHRLHFGGQVDQTAKCYNVTYNKTTTANVLVKYRLVKENSAVTVYVNDVRQNLAAGLSTTYSLTTFPIDTDLSAIKRIVIGSQSWGGTTIGSRRGPVKLSLSAIHPPNPAQPTLVYDEAYSRAQSFTNFAFNYSDEYYAIPSIPIRILNRNLEEQTVTTPAGLNYPNVHFLDYPHVTIAATGSYAYRSADNGQTWTQFGAASGYRTGMAIRHKGFNYIYNEVALNWTKVASGTTGGTTVTSNIGNKAANISNYIGKNDNVVLISQSQSATPTLLYVSWDYPTTVFSYYITGFTPNTQIYYVGSNVFACATNNSTVILLYVPQNPGTPVALKTIATTTFIAHLKGALVWRPSAGNMIYTAPLAARADNTAATQAEAQAYANEIEAAMTLGTELLPRATTTRVFCSRWGSDRLVEGDFNRVRIWQF